MSRRDVTVGIMNLEGFSDPDAVTDFKSSINVSFPLFLFSYCGLVPVLFSIYRHYGSYFPFQGLAICCLWQGRWLLPFYLE